MEDEVRNQEIVNGILAVLKTAPEIVMSWGLDHATIKPVECGLQFHVQGYKHKGNVVIKLNEGVDLYEVYLYEENGKLKESYTDIYVDQLIDTIDQTVEYTGTDYQERVNATYPCLRHARTIVIV